MTQNPACLKAVRVQLDQAHERVLTACKLLRTNGFPKIADELMRQARGLQVWTQKDGWIDCAARAPIAVAGASRIEAAE